jgi:hypothetical protein
MSQLVPQSVSHNHHVAHCLDIMNPDNQCTSLEVGLYRQTPATKPPELFLEVPLFEHKLERMVPMDDFREVPMRVGYPANRFLHLN